MSSETKGRSKRSYLQVKVNLSDTTPTGALILDALYSNDPEFFKRFGLGPKVTKANKLLWLAYLGLTQSNMSNGYVIKNLESEIEIEEESEPEVKPKAKPKRQKTVAVPPPPVELPQLPLESITPELPKLEMTKAEKVDDEDDLNEGALMAGLI